MQTTKSCIVGIKAQSGKPVRAFDVCIKNDDVYVNYSDRSTPEAHISYHKSGQFHIKKDKEYVEWTGGATGEMEPMKRFCPPPGTVEGRIDLQGLGWEVAKLDTVLAPLDCPADMMVSLENVGNLSGQSILSFVASVVGCEAPTPNDIDGYPIIASYRFGEAVQVEICAFIMSQE